MCLSQVPRGKFLIYSRSKPLIRVDKANTDSALVWLSYEGMDYKYMSLYVWSKRNFINSCIVGDEP